MCLLSLWAIVTWKKDGETKRRMMLTAQPTSETTVVEHSLSGGCFALGILSTYGLWLRKYTFLHTASMWAIIPILRVLSVVMSAAAAARSALHSTEAEKGFRCRERAFAALRCTLRHGHLTSIPQVGGCWPVARDPLLGNQVEFPSQQQLRVSTGLEGFLHCLFFSRSVFGTFPISECSVDKLSRQRRRIGRACLGMSDAQGRREQRVSRGSGCRHIIASDRCLH